MSGPRRVGSGAGSGSGSGAARTCRCSRDCVVVRRVEVACLSGGCGGRTANGAGEGSVAGA